MRLGSELRLEFSQINHPGLPVAAARKHQVKLPVKLKLQQVGALSECRPERESELANKVRRHEDVWVESGQDKQR